MQKSVQLPTDLFRRVESLQARHRLNTIADVIDASITQYERCRLPEEVQALERLTPRQRQILVLIADGQSVRQIAAKLNISIKTVEFHRTRIVTAMGIRSVALLARFAVRVGLVCP